MKFAAAFFALLVGSVSVKATEEATIDEQSNTPLLRGRGLSAPDPTGAKTDRCLLVNLKTMTESTLETTTALKYNFAEAGSAGWSVKCFGEAGKNVDYVKFFYDGENVSTQYYSPERFPKASDQPFWMRGDNKGGDVNPVDYLNSAGDKQFTVKFYTWPGGDQYPSDKKQYFLNGGGPATAPSKCTGVVCPFNSSCDNATGACNCNDSYVLKGGACVSPSKCDGVTCPASSVCNEATGACQCTGSLVLKNGACVPVTASPSSMCVNMLANGSFEETTVAPNTWAHFAPEQIPGWRSMNNERVELWGQDFQSIKAPDGKNILEIDFHHSEKIDHLYQDVKTNKGQSYLASFFIRARFSDFASPSETAIIGWNDKEQSFTAEKAGAWTKISLVVEGTGGLDRFSIRESSVKGASNAFGPLLDDFRLVTADCTGSTRSDDKPPAPCDGVTCPASSACNEATGACQCTGSLVLKNGACVPPSKCDGVTCTGGSACEEATATCKCAAGQVLKDNVCVAKPKCEGVTCPANSACDEATGICSICSAGFEFKFGVCTPIDRCGGVTCRHIHGAVCDPLTGKCGCRPKFVLEHGLLCVPACYRNLCPLGSYCSHITGDCMCHVPNQQLLNGVCRCPINKSDAFGVATGIPFDQGNGIVGCPQVIQAKLQADANVIRLGVLILHPYKWVEDGGVGGTSFGLSHFAHGEFISEVVACKDATAITYMKISTSKKRAIEGGIINGDCQVFKPIIGRAIVGFFGTATQRIHSIGVVYGPVPNLS